MGVITCYVNNLTNNGGAKGCADRARRANTSRWNITPAKMAACLGKAALEAQLGPLTWRPSKKNCHTNHWNERGIKERGTKERATKERNHKERTTKERTNKESSNKHRHRIGVKQHWWHGWINGWDGGMHWLAWLADELGCHLPHWL